MSKTAFKGNPVQMGGDLPQIGAKAPDFRLTNTDLADISLDSFSGKRVILNIFPSIDTGVCAASVRNFNQHAANMDNAVVVCVSKDLPFAHKRFCGAEGIENVVNASEFKDHSFSKAYGVEMQDGPLVGLMARSVVVVNEKGEVIHTEIVDDITHEPNYEAAMNVLK